MSLLGVGGVVFALTIIYFLLLVWYFEKTDAQKIKPIDWAKINKEERRKK